jgi:hypothetical protein
MGFNSIFPVRFENSQNWILRILRLAAFAEAVATQTAARLKAGSYTSWHASGPAFIHFVACVGPSQQNGAPEALHQGIEFARRHFFARIGLKPLDHDFLLRFPIRLGGPAGCSDQIIGGGNRCLFHT